MQIAFDEVYLRDTLLRDKGFLKQLYTNSTYLNKKLIIGADEHHLDTVIRICHLICNNEIPIFEHEHVILQQKRKLNFLKKKFKHNQDFINILEGTRENKVEVLLNLCNVFSCLFVALFEEFEEA